MPPDEPLPQEVPQASEPPKVESVPPETICTFCDVVAFNKCAICRRPFCKLHVSKSDITLCFDCAVDPTDAVAFETKIEPLIDDEGVKHTGKRITPVGDTFIANFYINERTDEEVEAMLMEYAVKIKDAEKMLYSRTVVYNTLRGVKADRDHKKKLAERAARVMRDASGAKTIVMSSASQKQAKTPAEPQSVADSIRARTASWTDEQKAEMLKNLAAFKLAILASKK